MIPYTITPRGVSFLIEGRPRNILNSHQNYDDIIKAIVRNDITELKELCDIGNFIAKITEGLVQISDDEVRYAGKKVNEYLAHRIIYHWKNDLPIAPLCNFTEKLMKNPTVDVRDDLFRWLENGNMPVCSNGNFVAYKVVRANFTPIHTGPYGQDQSVGKTVEMPREECNADRNATCAEGLHFCSYEYLPSFGYNSSGNVIIILEINPEDVVAIPKDYNLAKGRTCRFKVIGTVAPDEAKGIFEDVSIYDYEEYAHDWDDENPSHSDKGVRFNHKSTGTTWYEDDLVKMKKELGTYAAMSRKMNVPADTISNWFKKF